jgi:hypothetical protein
MALLGILWPIVGIVALVGFVWLCVAAFKQHVGWGLAVLFLSPFAAVFFAIRYWQESKRPFLVYMASFVLGMSLMVYTFAAVGGMAAMAMAEQIENGQITAEQATAQMAEQMQSSGMLSEEQEAELQEMQQMLAEARAAQEAEDAKAVTAGADSGDPQRGRRRSIRMVNDAPEPSEPEPPVASIDVVPPGFKRVPINQASDYLGREIKIVSKTGAEHRGRLTDVAMDVLYVERHLSSGVIGFELDRNDVDTLMVAYR